MTKFGSWLCVLKRLECNLHYHDNYDTDQRLFPRFAHELFQQILFRDSYTIQSVYMSLVTKSLKPIS